MNKLLGLLLFLLSPLWVFSQINVDVSGTVVNSDGEGLAGVTVYFNVDTTAYGFSYQGQTISADDGSYSHSFEVPDYEAQGVLLASILDCHDDYQIQESYWWEENNPVVDFVYCNMNCGTEITANETQDILVANTNGTAPYNYYWSTGESTQAININDTGQYCVTIVDALGCESSACYGELDCDELILFFTQSNDTISAQTNLHGDYTIYWSTGDSTNQIVATSSGEYCASIYYGAGCELNNCYTYTAGGTGVDSCAVSIVDTLGTLYAQAQGAAPYYYAWSTGDTTAYIPLGADTLYCVTVVDGLGCESTACYSQEATCDAVLSIQQSNDTLSVYTDLPASTYAVAWSTGDSTNQIVATSSGEYCASIYYGAGCELNNCYTYTAGGTGVDSCAVSIVDTLGTLYAQAQGAAPYYYAWNTGDTTAYIPLGVDTLYCVTVVDGLGCESTACYSQEATCDAVLSIQQSNDTLSVYTDLPASTYAVYWSTGDTTAYIPLGVDTLYCVTVVDGLGCESTACYSQEATCDAVLSIQQSNDTLSVYTDLPASTYAVYWSTGDSTNQIVATSSGEYCASIYYGAGCELNNCYTYTAGGTGVDSCAVSIVDTLGTLYAQAQGTAPYYYAWNTGDTTAYIPLGVDTLYCVTVVDGLGCESTACYSQEATCDAVLSIQQSNDTLSVYTDLPASTYAVYWSTGDSTNQIVATSSGEYCASIYYGVGCELNNCYTYTAGGTGVDSCAVSIVDTLGALYAQAQGAAPYYYAWNTGDTTAYIPLGVDTLYCVTVVDGLGCESTACYSQEATCDAVLSIQQSNDTLSVYTDLPASTYAVYWSTGDSTNQIVATTSGEYCASIYYGAGCELNNCYTYTAGGTGVDSCAVGIVDTLGALYAQAQGAAPYYYAWNTGDTTAYIPLGVDTLYCVTVVDGLGCESTACYENEYACEDGFLAIVQEEDTLSVYTNILTGTSFLWSTGETSSYIVVEEEGAYCVNMTYGENCELTACHQYIIGGGGADSCYVAIQNLGDSLVANAYGVAPFVYEWNTADTTAVIPLGDSLTYCVTVTDALGCEQTACYNTSFYLKGNVLDAEGTLMQTEGIVELYKIEDSAISFVASMPATANYQFNNLEAADYIVRAIYDDFIPTYHTTTYWWNEAEPISLTANDMTNYNIQLHTTIDSPSGVGSISGRVQEQTDNTAIEGAVIILFGSLSEEAIAYAITSADGTYVFPELPYGTYTVYIELLGYEQVYYTIMISADNENVSNVNFTVGEQTITDVEELQLETMTSWTLYPNPVQQALNIEFEKEVAIKDAVLSIISTKGQELERYQLDEPRNKLQLNVEHLPSGLYFVKLQTSTGVLAATFVKK